MEQDDKKITQEPKEEITNAAEVAAEEQSDKPDAADSNKEVADAAAAVDEKPSDSAEAVQEPADAPDSENSVPEASAKVVIEEVAEKVLTEKDAAPELQEEKIDLESAIAASAAAVVLKKGDKVAGTIINVSDDTALVDCGSDSDAILDLIELESPEVGAKVTGVVTATEPELKISTKITASNESREHLLSAFENKIPVSGKILSQKKGGFSVDVAGEQAFLPVSQLDLTYVQETDQYIGQDFDFHIIEYNPSENKFVVSRSSFLKKKKEQAAQEAWDKIEPGAVFDGEVKSIQSFGAFVDIGGVEGLVHISEISQSFTSHPSEFVKIGDAVKVKVLKADRDANRIGLSMKQLEPDPWENFVDAHNAGDEFSGQVVRRADFGLFVELRPGVDGLLHLSQLQPGTDMSNEIYKIGSTVSGRIRAIDVQNKRVSLTLRESEDQSIWHNLPEKYAVDAVLEGKVEESTKFGVFVELEPGLTGLMPLSELKKLGVSNPDEEYPPKSELKVRITALDPSRKRISLLPDGLEVPEGVSFERERAPRQKRRAQNKPKRNGVQHKTGDNNQGGVSSFGMLLKEALKQKS